MPENGSLDGDSTLVTGGSSGIGRAIAHALAEAGADVALAARREERLEEIAGELEDDHGAGTLVVPTDVTDDRAVDAMVDETVEEFGGLDLVVSNAGIIQGTGVASMPNDDYEAIQGVNIDGNFYTARAAIPHLRDSAGNLIFVGSFEGHYPRGFNPVYSASKWWIRGFAQSVAAGVGEDDVAVTVLNPSEVRTEFGSAYGRPFTEHFDPGEALEPEDIAEAVVFVASQPTSIPELDLYNRGRLSELF